MVKSKGKRPAGAVHVGSASNPAAAAAAAARSAASSNPRPSSGVGRHQQAAAAAGGATGERARASAAANSTEAILNRVEMLMDGLDFATAAQTCMRVLQRDPDNLRAIEAMGVIHLELGNPEPAFECFKRACALEPTSGADKFMYLGQMQSGKEAAASFETGTVLLKQEREQAIQMGEDPAEFTRRISTALASTAELYLTDLCHEDNAEELCGTLLEAAIAEDPTNAEAIQTFASYQISKQNPERALALLRDSLALWHRRRAGYDTYRINPNEDLEDDMDPEVADLRQVVDPMLDGEDVMDDQDLPPYDFRINTAKLLIELEQYEDASYVLGQLMREDDEVVQVWYMFGWLYFITSDYAAAFECLDTAQRMHAQTQCDDEPMLVHIQELLGEINNNNLIARFSAENGQSGENDDGSMAQ
ncbi:hypothetical protein CAOG_001124 [Capsaspora owczarzaki ATCC 30864]|uniref:Uncharacterized protein n=1 Tax=Capsaspora owczarzaki (strain ATCC 30864) TaxID=595528 RepID=A0A0D2U3C6_CAPO3|nr:hypothetical protein CAOG_001124 [Capsaspora owczarzaki ATCC 30864]